MMKNSLIIFLMIFCLSAQVLAQSTSLAAEQDPGHKGNITFSGVTFSAPKSFNSQLKKDSVIAYLSHQKYKLGLFVAAPGKEITDKYLKSISKEAAQSLFPAEKEFSWKILKDEDSRVSKKQTGGGITKGYNGKKYVQTDYVILNVKGKEIIVGYITQLGDYSGNAKYLFDLEGPGGMSMPGWYAQAHIIASITGEKYEEVNPGTYLTAAPIKTN